MPFIKLRLVNHVKYVAMLLGRRENPEKTREGISPPILTPLYPTPLQCHHKVDKKIIYSGFTLDAVVK